MLQPAQSESLTDEEIVGRVLRGDRPLFELIMRRHNERIYRTIRSILREEAEVEDAMQQAYVDAYAHLGDFAGRARFSTWLTRIAVHEALARKRRARPEGELMNDLPDPDRSPEQRTQDAETHRLLAAAIDELPEHFRTVFVLRSVQGLSVEETAGVLDLNTETVKTRLHRARGLLRKAILSRTEPALARALPFPATRCDRVVSNVMRRLELL
ncbi:MAG: RNA polymerase sigma factor [Myxococcales bacterium]|nr:RNA polymerase sigma factor [Myxococcales bacterium]